MTPNTPHQPPPARYNRESFERESTAARARADGAQAAAALVTGQARAGMTPGRIASIRGQGTARLLGAARVGGQARARAGNDTAAPGLRDLPDPDRSPGAPHPDPVLAARGWHVCRHGIYTRQPEPDAQARPGTGLEAGA